MHQRCKYEWYIFIIFVKNIIIIIYKSEERNLFHSSIFSYVKYIFQLQLSVCTWMRQDIIGCNIWRSKHFITWHLNTRYKYDWNNDSFSQLYGHCTMLVVSHTFTGLALQSNQSLAMNPAQMAPPLLLTSLYSVHINRHKDSITIWCFKHYH